MVSLCFSVFGQTSGGAPTTGNHEMICTVWILGQSLCTSQHSWNDPVWAPQRKIQKPGGPSPALSAPSWAIHCPTLSNCFVSFGFGAYHDIPKVPWRRRGWRHAKLRGKTNGSTYEVEVKMSDPEKLQILAVLFLKTIAIQGIPHSKPWPM